MTGPSFAPFERKMRDAGMPDVAIDTFRRYFELLKNGETGTLSRHQINPVEELPDAEQLSGTEAFGQEAVRRAVVLKLNGGLGTGMGMTRAKSIVPVKQGLTFLDVIARQVLHVRQALGCELPLVLMNSYRTREDTLRALLPYPSLRTDLPFDFLQHRVPRIRADDFTPVEWSDDPAAEWCPPGHGDVYTALQTSGMLAALRERGFEYLFLSNSDNLGAVVDLRILGWFASGDAPFLMEVAHRTASDRKGGHLARLRDGRLTLRETVQCPPDEIEDFQDVRRYRYFNTNNLWVKLSALERVLEEHDRVLPLPMMRNEKTVVPTDAATPKVIQTETAMGAALSVFPGAAAMRVPRDRFAPVKSTNDLLGLWSDLYTLDDSYRVLPSGGKTFRDVVIDLDARYYKAFDRFQERFPHGAPSLRECDHFEVRGDVTFGRDVVARGTVRLHHDGAAPLRIADRSTLG